MDKSIKILETNKTIDERIKTVLPKYLQTSAFMKRKLTDTPTDNNQVVSRGYVTMHGVTGSRPTSPVTGQFYYDTTIDRPIWWNGSNWKNAAGTTV